jgi:hypothetical protein
MIRDIYPGSGFSTRIPESKKHRSPDLH